MLTAKVMTYCVNDFTAPSCRFSTLAVGSRVMLVSAKVCLLVNNERFNINHTSTGGGSWQTPEELPLIAVVCAKYVEVTMISMSNRIGCLWTFRSLIVIS